MTRDRLFMDTAFVQALLNKRDQYHPQALSLLPRLKAAHEVWTTEAILVEVGNALSAIDRSAAVEFIAQCYRLSNMTVVSVDRALFFRALRLYDTRSDKTWGFTDCISFEVMKDQNLVDAITTDHHFIQAGYRALMRGS